MNERRAARVAWALAVIALVATGVGLGFRATSGRALFGDFAGVAFVMGATFPPLGALIASRRSRNSIGWVFLGVGLSWGLLLLLGEAGRYGLITRPGSVPASVLLLWVNDWIWLPGFGLLMLFPLLFPDGRPPSWRWRWVLWSIVGATALATVARAWGDWQFRGPMLLPQGEDTPFSAGPWQLLVDGPALLLGGIASVVSLFFRLRRSSREERQQIRWVGYSTFLVFAAMALDFAFSDRPLFSLPLFPLIPAAAAVAILKYRLYDIDVVISKTVVFGALAAFFTAIYVAVVIGVGTLVGSRSNSLLTVVAAVIIAVAFEPLRQRVRRFANRLVYGNRATPYEVLSEFSERVSSAYSSDDVLPQMARILGEGTGSRRAEVWVNVGGVLRLDAVWPEGEDDRNGAATVQSPDAISEMDRVAAVTDRGELLGALAVAKPPAEPLTPTEDKLLSDLASQAGLVLRNVRLIEELRASRARLVKAQDEERRRLERNIHDGAQQQLVSLAVKLRLVEAMADRDAAKTKDLAAQLQAEAQEALENLRDLARGIYPPLLADKGLAAALEAQSRKVSVPVGIETDGIGRYAQEAEAAVYFSTLEALQNVAKYAGATRATIRLADHDGELRFSISDDGRGFDAATTSYGTGLQGMADRIEALGGRMNVMSRPGQGTTVEGVLPVRRLVVEPR